MNYENWKKNKPLLESFKRNSTTKLLSLISSYMKRKLNINVTYSLFPENLVFSDGEYTGISFYTSDYKRFRINHKNSIGSFEISSVDIWLDNSDNIDYNFKTKGMNINTILSFINICLNNKTTEEELAKSFLLITVNNDVKINEALSTIEKDELTELIKQSHFTIRENYYDVDKVPKNTLKRISELILKDIDLTIGNSSTTETTVEDFVVQDILVETPQEIQEPKEIKLEEEFSKETNASKIGLMLDQDLTAILDGVAQGIHNAVILSGTPGIGKTYSIKNTLKKKYGLKENRDFKEYGGNITPLGLYKTLYEWKDDKILILDDIDSVFKKDNSVLKKVLDNYLNREVSWISSSREIFDPKNKTGDDIDILLKNGKYPNNFVFSSSVIFITNIPIEKLEKAVTSRCISMDLSFTKEDIIERMKEILPIIDIGEHSLTIQEKEEIFQLLISSETLSTREVELSLRTFVKMAKVYISMKLQPNGIDWKKIALNYC